MLRWILWTLSIFLSAPSPNAPSPVATAEAPKGHLIIIGGGSTTDEMPKRAIALSGKEKPVVLVLPQASGRDDAGQKSVAMWTELGAVAALLENDDRAAAHAAVQAADIIWMPGGAQTRLLEFLTKNGIDEKIRARFRDGAVVGGTSAGAAVMSDAMITGEFDGEGLTAKTTETVPGLGLVKAVIVDQHFHKRRRFNRLLSAVLDRPALVGMGIDESTAIVLSGRRLEVIGKSSVLVVDARQAKVAPAEKGAILGAAGVLVHVWPTGTKIELDFDPFTAPK